MDDEFLYEEAVFSDEDIDEDYEDEIMLDIGEVNAASQDSIEVLFVLLDRLCSCVTIRISVPKT